MISWKRVGTGVAILIWLIYTAWGDINAMLAVAAATGYFFYIADRM